MRIELANIPYIIPQTPEERLEISQVLLNEITKIENRYSIDTLSAILHILYENNFRMEDVVEYISSDKDLKESIRGDILSSDKTYLKKFIDDERSSSAADFGFF